MWRSGREREGHHCWAAGQTPGGKIQPYDSGAPVECRTKGPLFEPQAMPITAPCGSHPFPIPNSKKPRARLPLSWGLACRLGARCSELALLRIAPKDVQHLRRPAGSAWCCVRAPMSARDCYAAQLFHFLAGHYVPCPAPVLLCDGPEAQRGCRKTSPASDHFCAAVRGARKSQDRLSLSQRHHAGPHFVLCDCVFP